MNVCGAARVRYPAVRNTVPLDLSTGLLVRDEAEISLYECSTQRQRLYRNISPWYFFLCFFLNVSELDHACCGFGREIGANMSAMSSVLRSFICCLAVFAQALLALPPCPKETTLTAFEETITYNDILKKDGLWVPDMCHTAMHACVPHFHACVWIGHKGGGNRSTQW